MDQQKREAFEGRVMSMLNESAVVLMLSIGHRTGLFDAMSQLPPSTSQEIADAAGLDERYVREWLAALVTGGVVEHDATFGTYRLPPEHAACLTRAATPGNLAVVAQYIPTLAAVEDQIVDCFERGGGVPYSGFERFHDVMAEDSAQTVVSALEEHILPLVPGLTERLEEGIDFADVGCGSGRALCALARRFPNSRFAGFDFSEEGIGRARAEARRLELENVRFEVRDAATLVFDESYDVVATFDAIHDQADPAAVLRNIHRMLRPGGTYLMQDISASSHLHENADHPLAPFLYTVSCMHCMTVSLAYGGDGLGTMWGRQKALEMLEAAGFRGVEVNQLAHDIMNDFFVAKKSATAREAA